MEKYRMPEEKCTLRVYRVKGVDGKDRRVAFEDSPEKLNFILSSGRGFFVVSRAACLMDPFGRVEGAETRGGRFSLP